MWVVGLRTVPGKQTQDIRKHKTFVNSGIPLATNRKHSCWDCSLGSDASTLHASVEGSSYFLSTP